MVSSRLIAVFASSRGTARWNASQAEAARKFSARACSKSIPSCMKATRVPCWKRLPGKRQFVSTIPTDVPTAKAECRYTPLVDEDNNIIGGIAIITDITARKQAEEAVHAAYSRLAFHVDSLPLAVVEWDSDFRVSRWSKSAERLFGWTARSDRQTRQRMAVRVCGRRRCSRTGD